MTFPTRAVRRAVPHPSGPLAVPWRAVAAPERPGEVTTALAPVRAVAAVPAAELPDDPGSRREAVLAFVADHRPRLLRLGLHLVVAALPLLAISVHVFGLAPMHLTAGLVVVPLTLLVLLLGLFAPVPEDRLVVAGVVWGVLATLVYDAVRLDTVYLLGLWGDFIPTVGTWIVDVDAGSSVVGAIVGYLWRYVGDGGGIGVAFFVLVAATGLRRWGQRATVAAAVVFAVFPVWTGLVATVAIAPRGEQQMFPLTVTTVSLSLLGHLVFGLVLGLGCARCRGLEEYWPWTPLLDLRRGVTITAPAVARAPVAPDRRAATDDTWGPPEHVTAGGDPEVTEIRVERPARAGRAVTAARGVSRPPSGPVRVADAGPHRAPTPSGPLPVAGPRSGPVPVTSVGRAPGAPRSGCRGAPPAIGPASGPVRVPVPVSGPIPVSGAWSRPVPRGAADPWPGPGRGRPTGSVEPPPGATARH